MPYCPICRGEYREGYTHCTKCDADLVEQLPPPAPHPPMLDTIPSPLQRFIRSWIDVWHTVITASLRGWQVFRSARTLVWLVVAAVGFSIVLGIIGNVITFTATTPGRDLRDSIVLNDRWNINHTRRTPFTDAFRFRTAFREFHGWVEGLLFESALLPISLYVAPVSGDIEPLKMMQITVIFTGIGLLLALPLAFWQGGLLTIIWARLFHEKEGSKNIFMRGARKTWWRISKVFWIIVVIEALIGSIGTFHQLQSTVNRVWVLPFSWGVIWNIFLFLPSVLFAFALIFIVVDDNQAGAAIKRSIGFLFHHWREALIFFVLLTLLRWIILAPAGIAAITIPQPIDPLYATFTGLPRTILHQLGIALLSLWFTISAMAWYMGKPAPSDPFARSQWQDTSGS